ncbi:uncharacterized protein BT62DRAFT_343253 [Guyanagaster necrorhizus]|uniref:Uncharacterized protein n=1 Tax=Guyanagaster necrorhizus TaxID=856835 RepID=A0A9P7VN91_9AGAR|nr:uncharacterized protein BT62DRAFT_343253 [Guyanagaster necrorhizus MCA 3950]KAG7442979.1 hypothetical protein BT62DRAFT_343253 [Guyanagaster necrorhizus MCA 3950]
MLSFVALFSAFFFAVAIAYPMTKLQELIVWSPTITSPTSSTNWCAGTPLNVTWDMMGMPEDGKNSTGLLLLGHQTQDSENLDIHHPLANGFPLSRGWVFCTMPNDTAPRSDYIVVLFGDSGNASPRFNVSGPDPAAQ